MDLLQLKLLTKLKLEQLIASAVGGTCRIQHNYARSIWTSSVGSVHLFHPACILLSSLQRWHLAIISSILRLFVSLVDAKPKLNHAVDPLGVHCRLLKSEAGGEEGSLKEQHDQVLN